MSRLIIIAQSVALSFVFAIFLLVQPAMAGTAPAAPGIMYADSSAVGTETYSIPDMPASAAQGLWCFGGAAASIAAAYAIGPSEIIMMVTGAMHIPSSGALTFLPLYAILAGGTCGLASAAQPAVGWLMQQSGNIAAAVGQSADALHELMVGAIASQYADSAVDDSSTTGGAAIRPMENSEIQSVGCIAGAGGGLLAALAAGPSEVVMLSAGGITVASTTPVLAMGLLGTIVAASCSIGNYALLPIITLFRSLGSGGADNAQAQASSTSVGNSLAAAVSATKEMAAHVVQGLKGIGDKGVLVADAGQVSH